MHMWGFDGVFIMIVIYLPRKWQ